MAGWPILVTVDEETRKVLLDIARKTNLPVNKVAKVLLKKAISKRLYEEIIEGLQ